MVKSSPLLKPLINQFLKEVKAYGILEVSLEQYHLICNSIVRFAQSLQVDSYSPELVDSYKDNLDTRCSSGEICKEYHRFQLRVMRMLSSLAESGVVDFSSAKSHPLRYIVSDETNSLVEMILDSYPISNAAKNDLRAPTRHFLWYAEQFGIKPQCIDDSTVMSFLIDEVPVSNGGSTGRTLRYVKYVTEYLRAHGNCFLHRDYALLKLKNDHRRIISAYSEEEISGIAQVLDGLSFIGNDYQKLVEVFTVQTKKVFGLNTSRSYFDCTNFYFEIDRVDDFYRKGPSKENKKEPIVELGLQKIPISGFSGNANHQ